MCKGFLFWPESSHTDTLALRYFTENAWRRGAVGIDDVLDEFCASRYGTAAEKMKRAWELTIPISRILGWGDNYGRTVVYCTEGLPEGPASASSPSLGAASAVFRLLSDVDLNDEFVRRDAVDLARTVADRGITDLCCRMLKAYGAWCAGTGDGAHAVALAEAFARAGDLMADLLELHTDYSLYESYLRLKEIAEIRNQHFEKVLFDNAACDYCHSHQYELARHWYAPVMRELSEAICWRARLGRREPLESQVQTAKTRRERLKEIPFSELRPRAPRTASRLRSVLRHLADAFAKPQTQKAVEVHPNPHNCTRSHGKRCRRRASGLPVGRGNLHLRKEMGFCKKPDMQHTSSLKTENLI